MTLWTKQNLNKGYLVNTDLFSLKKKIWKDNTGQIVLFLIQIS